MLERIQKALFGGETADQTAGEFDEIGVSGVNIQSGHVYEEFLVDLQGEKGRRKYREMSENDAVIGAILNAIEMTIRSANWNIKASEDDPEEKGKEFLESVLDDMSFTWEDTISEILTMLPYGWQYSEMVAKRRMGPDQKDPSKRSKHNDGLIGIRKIAPRSQQTLDRWETDEDGGVRGMWQQPPNGGASVFIPIERSLLFRTVTANGNPEGRSILRKAYTSYHKLTNIQAIEAIAIERELAGLPVVRIPKEYLTSTKSEIVAIKNQYIKMARDLKFNSQGAVLIPSDSYKDKDGNPTSEKLVDIDLMSASGSRTIDTGATVRRYQQDIAMTVLADFILLGMGKTGSFSLSKDKTSMFNNSLIGYMNSMAAVFNRFMIPRLWEWNSFPVETMPELVPGKVAPVDLEVLGDYISKLSLSGVPLFPNEELENYVLEEAGLPVSDD